MKMDTKIFFFVIGLKDSIGKILSTNGTVVREKLQLNTVDHLVRCKESQFHFVNKLRIG